MHGLVDIVRDDMVRMRVFIDMRKICTYSKSLWRKKDVVILQCNRPNNSRTATETVLIKEESAAMSNGL